MTMTADAAEIVRLAAEVEAAKGFDNSLDIRCEIALFEPDDSELAIRANTAGTKVVVTIAGVGDRSFLARDFTISAGARRNTAAALRARAASALSDGEG